MAIKGKKKSQHRGSQARRRPAAAPRPAISGRSRTAWYRTPGGRVAAAVLVAGFFGLVAWGIGTLQSNARADDQRRRAIDEYTGEVRTLTQDVNQVVADMTAIPLEPTEEDVEAIPEDTRRWNRQVQQSTTKAVQILPPPGLENVNRLFSQALTLYGAAADTFALVPEAEGKLRQDLMTRAATQRDQATGLFLTAIALLDGLRNEEGMPASGIDAPGTAAPPPTPVPTLTVPPGDGDGGKESEDGAGGKRSGRDRDRRGGKNDKRG